MSDVKVQNAKKDALCLFWADLDRTEWWEKYTHYLRGVMGGAFSPIALNCPTIK